MRPNLRQFTAIGRWQICHVAKSAYVAYYSYAGSNVIATLPEGAATPSALQ